MDEPWRHQWDRRMEPQRLVEHGIQVRQPRQVILRDLLVSAHILDFPVETILMCQEPKKYLIKNLCLQETRRHKIFNAS